MRMIGTQAMGLRFPIVSQGDDLVEITAHKIKELVDAGVVKLHENDVLAITEAIVAKAQNNYASLGCIAKDVAEKFPNGEVGVVFPILSRNRFAHILKGIAQGVQKVYLLLSFPQDEVGNPIMDTFDKDVIEAAREKGFFTKAEFQAVSKGFLHPFTQMNYLEFYESLSDNIEIYVSDSAKNILKLTDNIIVAEVHARFSTKSQLLRAGAKNVYCLHDILSKPIDGSGYNPDYGVIGSNLATDDKIKLFPINCQEFVDQVQKRVLERTGVEINVMIYGDGAFKDPVCGIWELDDPVVCPAHTLRLEGKPSELKIKYLADNQFGNLSNQEKEIALKAEIAKKGEDCGIYSLGTTPRRYVDLLGSLCDLVTGSGDKGTPVVLVQGYFDNFASE